MASWEMFDVEMTLAIRDRLAEKIRWEMFDVEMTLAIRDRLAEKIRTETSSESRNTATERARKKAEELMKDDEFPLEALREAILTERRATK